MDISQGYAQAHGVLSNAGKINRMPSRSEAPAAALRPHPEDRSRYRWFCSVATRWGDNDVYGHVNNVVYYAWFDTAVNTFLIDHGALDIYQGASIGLVVETGCNYFSPVSFPGAVEIGLRVAKTGTSSVRYELGVFTPEGQMAAKGHFVHVYVDAKSRRPSPLSGTMVNDLELLK